jgi:hypothetical protein
MTSSRKLLLSWSSTLAKRLGLSRSAYLRRALERERSESSGSVTLEALERLASLTADLDDPDVMSDAWS